jgi:hypothetical protein
MKISEASNPSILGHLLLFKTFSRCINSSIELDINMEVEGLNL